MHIRAAQAGWAFHYIAEPLMTYRIQHEQLTGEPGFREHEVELWRRFAFAPGSVEESLRRRFLAEALLSSAAWKMKQGQFGRAGALAREARRVEISVYDLSWRARVTSLVSRSRLTMQFAAGLVRLRKNARGILPAR